MIPLRDENPTRRKPVVTVSLIVANCAVHIWVMLQPVAVQNAVAYRFGAIPLLLFGPAPAVTSIPLPWLTLVSSMFLHGSLLHLGGNMLYLWIFGNNIEDRLGHAKFILFYLLSGIAAALAHALTNLQSAVPMIGASGAVSGILGAYILLFPRARVVTMIWFFLFIRFVRVPAFVVLGVWFVLQLTNVLGGAAGQTGGIAFWAHIGGFLFGAAAIFLFRPSRSIPIRYY